VSEAVTNVIKHAYRDGPGRIYVTAAIASGDLWVLISDDGSGLRADTDSGGLGVGLALIATASDELSLIRRATGGTELRMCFALDLDHRKEPDQPRGSVIPASVPASSRFSTTR
jgi:anti-sigma regulatory factor (Ser/Thr protein kinase)